MIKIFFVFAALTSLLVGGLFVFRASTVTPRVSLSPEISSVPPQGSLPPEQETSAQTRSSRTTIDFQGVHLNLEVALTNEETNRGLSGRDTLPEDQGMLFIFDTPDRYSFWMKGMRFPLDIIWIGDDFRIVDMTRGVSEYSFPETFRPKFPVKYVLEVNAGWLDRHGVTIGTHVPIESIVSQVTQSMSKQGAGETIGEPREEIKSGAGEDYSEADQVILFDVPFTSQAPFGEWSDDIQQNACEEAAALMAMRWVDGEGLTKEEAKKEIIAISNYERNNFENYVDTSSNDTVERIFNGYFGYDGAEAKHDISIEDIKTELQNGNLVIVPVNGQRLANPHYTPPGPLRHMLVIRGYDAGTGEFITNDPGTRYGEGYRYSETILENVLQDYLTGDHKPILEIRRSMIVVPPRD